MNTKSVFQNAKWIVACRIAQSAIQLVIGMISARYLGPSNYGLINYAASIVAFALPLMRLGFNATLVHELIEAPKKEGEILGTSLLLNFLSSLLCILGVTAFVTVVNAGDNTTILVCILYSISLIFSALEMIQYWFQYKLKSKYSSVVMLIAYVLASLYKVFLLLTGKSVYWFALVNCFDYAIISLLLLAIYFKIGKARLSFSFSLAKAMLSKSKHYILSGIMVVAFQTTDHIMLLNMIDEKENGYYTAAITAAGVVQFVYTAIIDSYRPLILSNKKENSGDYKKNISSLYSIIVYLALAQSAAFFVLAKPIITVLYGSNYMPSVSVIRILVWYVAFSYMGSVRNIWILAEQKQKYLWIINLSGAIINVILNLFLIPVLGARGAAIASLLTQFLTNFVLGFILSPIKENNILLLKGMNPKFAFYNLKKLLFFLRKNN